MQPGGEQVFYAGDNGEVGTFSIPRGDRYVSSDSHRCLAGMPCAPGTDTILCISGVYPPNLAGHPISPLPRQQAISANHLFACNGHLNTRGLDEHSVNCDMMVLAAGSACLPGNKCRQA